MKNFLTIILIILSYTVNSAIEVNGRLQITLNDGDSLKVSVQLNTSGTAVAGLGQLGKSTIPISFNQSDLSTPTNALFLIENKDFKLGPEFVDNVFYEITVTKPNIDEVYLNINLLVPEQGVTLADNGGWTELLILTFKIDNPSGTTNLIWLTSIGDFEIFDDDNATEYTYAAGTLGTFTNETGTPLPVELTNFTAQNTDDDVNLNWETATEVDNYGFELERSLNTSEKEWKTVGFIPGYGNSNSPKEYTYVDHSPIGGNKFIYRLKQIDNDGTFTYSDAVEIEVIPNKYELYQNYPNPFNPSTTIRFSLRETQNVKIVIFDQLGQEVQTIVNQQYEAGYHEFEFNAANIASGVYFYRIIAGDFVNVKKMMLLK